MPFSVLNFFSIHCAVCFMSNALKYILQNNISKQNFTIIASFDRVGAVDHKFSHKLAIYNTIYSVQMFA